MFLVDLISMVYSVPAQLHDFRLSIGFFSILIMVDSQSLSFSVCSFSIQLIKGTNSLFRVVPWLEKLCFFCFKNQFLEKVFVGGLVSAYAKNHIGIFIE